MEIKIELLNKAEAAERARIKPVTLDKMIRLGNGPTVTRIGGRVFFRPEDMSAWIDAQRVKPFA